MTREGTGNRERGTEAADSQLAAGIPGVRFPVPRSRLAGKMLLYLTLLLGAALALAPILWMLSASLMPTGEASTYPPRVVPSREQVPAGS